VAGEEVHSLRLEIDKFQLQTKKFILQLADVAYIDSGGLGAIVRLLATLRSARGDLKLCQLSPIVQQTLVHKFKGFISYLRHRARSHRRIFGATPICCVCCRGFQLKTHLHRQLQRSPGLSQRAA
jgi:anti-anti-sigma factor